VIQTIFIGYSFHNRGRTCCVAQQLVRLYVFGDRMVDIVLLTSSRTATHGRLASATLAVMACDMC
jgi:hypothetical protein